MSGKVFKQTEKIIATDAIRIQTQIINSIHEKFPSTNIIKIGSIGQKENNEYHGDIDIAIQVSSFSELCRIVDEVFPNYQKTELNNKMLYVYSMKLPYTTFDNKEKFVQVDFMFSNEPEYTKFRYHCPNFKEGESEYKVYAKILLLYTLFNNTDGRLYRFHPTHLSIIDKETKKEIEETNISEIIKVPFHNPKVEMFHSVERMWKEIHSPNFKYPENLKRLELQFFIACYKEPWEELYVDPFDFELTEWTPEEIWEKMHEFDYINEINLRLIEVQKR